MKLGPYNTWDAYPGANCIHYIVLSAPWLWHGHQLRVDIGDNKTIHLDSTGDLVKRWLFCIQKLPCLVSFGCMLGVSVEVWTKQFYIGSLRAKLNLTSHRMLIWTTLKVNLNLFTNFGHNDVLYVYFYWRTLW